MTEPTLVYDDDCGFCTWWAEFFDERTEIRLVGFSDLPDHPDLQERLPEFYEECSHLVTEDAVYSCGQSLEEALRRYDDGGPVANGLEFLRNFEDYEHVREWGYRQVANNRDKWGKVMSKTPPARRDREDSE